MSQRKPIGKRLRFEVFKRDDFTCQYCGSHPPKVVLHIDHITPVAAGGGNEIENLITACSVCNMGKAAIPLDVKPRSLADKAAEVAEREAQIAGYAEVMEAARDRIEADCWRVAEELQPGAEAGYSRSRFASIKRFVEELGFYEVLEAAEIATSRRVGGAEATFRYFCGICWNKIGRDEE